MRAQIFFFDSYIELLADEEFREWLIIEPNNLIGIEEYYFEENIENDTEATFRLRLLENIRQRIARINTPNNIAYNAITIASNNQDVPYILYINNADVIINRRRICAIINVEMN